MKRTLVIISVLALLTTGLLTGCVGSQTVPTYTDSNQTINMNLNQEFTIALQANPTTGYDWQPVFDAGLINQVTKEYKQDDHSGQQLVGSGGTDFFTFKALKAGQVKITFTYFRAWETPKPEDKQQVFNIVIK
jgi:inhibitor of cysteine peptidase